MKVFKDFKVGYFFTMESGRNVTKNLMVNEGLPVIQGGETNRGVLGFVSEDFALENKLNIIEDPLFLTVARVGSSGYVALHDKKSVIGDNAKVLRCKLPYSLNVMLYLQTCLNKFGIFYDYSNVVSEKNYLNHLISLPVTPDGSPDYAYMEDYIKGIQRQYIDNLLETNEAERNRLLSIVGLSLDEYERVKGSIVLCDAENYGEFKVGDLFEIESISQIPRGYNVDLTGVGHPYISQSSENKGIKGYTEDNVLTLNKKNAIVLGVDTISQGVINWIDEDFYANKMLALRSSKLNKHNAPYIITMILKKSMIYDYNNKVSKAKLLEMFIQLPTTPTGEVDYAYMEDYISKIKLIYIYNRELSVNHQVRLLESLIV